jgi:predicted protein tyrosine phosphatase
MLIKTWADIYHTQEKEEKKKQKKSFTSRMSIINICLLYFFDIFLDIKNALMKCKKRRTL